MQRDPASVPPHHLEHHDPLVAGGSRMEPVERVGGTGHRRVESKRECRGAEIIVDRFWNADDGDAPFVKLLGDGERAVAADADKTAHGELADGGGHLVKQGWIDGDPLVFADGGGESPFVRGAEDGAALSEDAGGVSRGERHIADRLDEAFVAAEKADAVVSQPL